MASKPPIKFVPECNVDTAVVREARGRTDSIIHREGVYVVAEFMQVRPQALLVGMVDDDDARKRAKGGQKRREPDYFREFAPLAGFSGEQVRFLHHPHRPHFLIQVQPACDRWLYDCVTQTSLRPRDAGFPTNDYDSTFIKRTKALNSYLDPAVIRLFKAVRQAQVADFRQIQLFIRQFEDPPQWLLDHEAQ